jgi:hypothetical protein
MTASGATLRADIDHAVSGGQVTWEYGKTTTYGSTTLPVSLAVQDSIQHRSLPLSCLTAATTYHVRAVATDGLVTVYGGDKSFKTTAAAPGSVPDPACTAPAGGTGTTDGSGSTGTTTTGGGTGTTTSTTTTGTTTTPGTTTTETTTSGSTTSDGSGATTPPGVATATLTPALGKSIAMVAVRGRVTATAPSGAPVDLATAQLVPTGTVIDTRAGVVELKSALDAAGDAQVARFWGGKFQVRQDTGHRGLTQLVLRGGDFSRCPSRAATAGARAAATTKKTPPRSLWGSDSHGRYQTRGRGSVATVRGTRWVTQDRCDGTLTRVVAGAVAVRDLRRHRTVVVAKGHSYLARVGR